MREDGALGKLLAEMVNERLVGEPVEAVATDTSVEITLGKRKMRGNFRHGVVKHVVKTSEMHSVGEYGLRGGNQFEGLGNMHRSKMRGGAKRIEKLRSDALMRDEVRPAMDDAMANGHGRGVDVFFDGFRDDAESVDLRFVDGILFHQSFAGGRTYLKRAVILADAVGAAGEKRLLIAGIVTIHAEFEGRGTAIEDEDEVA